MKYTITFNEFLNESINEGYNRTSNKYKTRNVEWDDVAPGDYIADGPNIGEVSVVISNTKKGFILKRVWNNIRKKDGEEFFVPHDHDAMKDHPKSIIRVENFVEESTINERAEAFDLSKIKEKDVVELTNTRNGSVGQYTVKKIHGSSSNIKEIEFLNSGKQPLILYYSKERGLQNFKGDTYK